MPQAAPLINGGGQFSKQSERPSAAIVAAPLMIAAARLRVNVLGLLADRFFGEGRIAARRADCMADRLDASTPK